MPLLKVKVAFKWAHRNVDIKEYVPGDVIETDDKDLIRVAHEENWVVRNRTVISPNNSAAEGDKLPPTDLQVQEPIGLALTPSE